MVTIKIFGEIWLGRVTRFVRAALEQADDKPVRVILDSVGGSFDESMAIRDLLAEYPGTVNVAVLRARSGAALIATAGDTITIAPAGDVMLHHPSTRFLLPVNAADLRRAVASLDSDSRRVARLTAKRAGLPVAKVRELMNKAETISAKRAVRLGLADRIDKSLPDPSATESAVHVAWSKN